MHFELQLSAEVFTRIVRNRLKAIPLCTDREFVDAGTLTGIAGAIVVVDRIEIGDTTSIQREQVQQIVDGLQKFVPGATQVVWIFWPTNYTSFTLPFLQVKQEVRIHLVKASDLEINGAQPTTPFKTLTLHLVFNVTLEAAKPSQGGGPIELSYSLAYIDYGPLFASLPAPLRANVETYVAGIQLAPTALDLGPLTSMLKRPVSGINAGIVCDPGSTFVAMRVDFDVYDSPVAVTPQFFTNPPENLLGGRAWAMLVDKDALVADARTKAKKALTGDAKLRLESGPHVSWDPGTPAINIQADVELVNACPFFVDDIDMDVDVQISVKPSVPVANTVRTNYHLEGSPSNPLEELACALTGALLWPFIGPLFLKDEDLGEGIGAYIGGLAAGPLIMFIGILAVIETKGLSKDISKQLGSTCKKLDDENYECNEEINAVMQLTPPNNSRLEIERVSGNQRGLVFSGGISNFRDFLMGGLEPVRVCPFNWQVLGRCTGNGRSNFHVGNQASIHVFGTPPAGLCHARILYDPQNEFSMSIQDGAITIVPRFRPGYTASPYPCKVRVVTNRGVRTITLQPPAARTAAESEKLEQARLASHLGCYYWEEEFTPIEKIKWRPDPPFDRERYLQFWQIAVRGLQREESVRVASARGETMMTANPSRSGIAHFALMLTPEQAQPEVELELRGRRGQDEHQREISLQQVLFEHQSSVPASAPVQSMRIEGGARSPRLVVVHDDGHEVSWDLSTPVAPSLLESMSFRGEHREKAVRPELVVHTGRRVGAAAGPNLLRALDRLSEQYGAPEVVGSPRVGGAKETVYVRSTRGARLFDISDEGQLREMHVYEQPAWFEGIAMGGRLVARYDIAGGKIDIYIAAASKECS